MPTADEQVHALTQAVICAILAQAGPQRARLLNTLYKDERVHSGCAALVRMMLENVHLGRMLRPETVKEFGRSLAEHQLATTSDGMCWGVASVAECHLMPYDFDKRCAACGRVSHDETY